MPQLAAVLSSHRASRHVASPSLGQDASLSFVVIGRGQLAGWLIREIGNWGIRELVKELSHSQNAVY